MSSGGRQRLAHLREMASDADKLREMTRVTEGGEARLLANSEQVLHTAVLCSSSAPSPLHARFLEQTATLHQHPIIRRHSPDPASPYIANTNDFFSSPPLPLPPDA